MDSLPSTDTGTPPLGLYTLSRFDFQTLDFIYGCAAKPFLYMHALSL